MLLLATKTAAKTALVLTMALGAQALALTPAAAKPPYPWRNSETPATRHLSALEPPPGFDRTDAAPGSFAHWLRNLPMKPETAAVRLFDGREKARQDVHAAIIDIDVGRRDLQQCADAVMRLRAEWLYATGRDAEIAFDFTGGGRVPYRRYALGERPDATGRHWRHTSRANASYKTFRRYMDLVFAYAGTASLEKELEPVSRTDLAIGDVFIKGGFPGHAVLIVDMAENRATGAKRFLLAQSYMPAQDIHILKDPASTQSSPWYEIPAEGDPLVTPEWTFAAGSLRRWP